VRLGIVDEVELREPCLSLQCSNRNAGARMPQLARIEIKQRAARLRAKGEAATIQRHLSLVGSRQTLLVERPGMGRSECFTPVAFDAGQAAVHSSARASRLRAATNLEQTSYHERLRRSAATAHFYRAAEEGLSRSTAGLSDNIAGIFTKTKLDARSVAQLKKR